MEFRGRCMNDFIVLVTTSWRLLGQGIMMTILLWVVTASLSLTVGLWWGILRSDKLRRVGIAQGLDAVTFVLRGVPCYVQLLLAYFVIPDLLGINIPAFASAA